MEIEFGQVREEAPNVGLRPDQDAHFAVAAIGQVDPHDLKIFVDLDVMREMEAHARSNTKVELGGVMLGCQQIDDAGVPFVHVTESLRAAHYKATQGSFTFTHETWTQITRDRGLFHPNLAMVGWYHTHPGWSVFLSSMDLFICDHFFKRQLDVALVIDPCADDRGWFQWPTDVAADNQPHQPNNRECPSDDPSDDPKQLTGERNAVSTAPRRTGGFYLTTGRLRQQELDLFVKIYQKDAGMPHDPRFSGPISTTLLGQPRETATDMIDNRRPIFELAIVAMLLMQFCFLMVLGWRMMSPVTSTPNWANAANTESAGSSFDLSNRADGIVTINQSKLAAYQEILEAIASKQLDDPQFADRYVHLQESHAMLNSNLRAQLVMTEKLESDRNEYLKQLEATNRLNEKLSDQLQTTRLELKTAQELLALAEKTQQNPAQNGDSVTTTESMSSGLTNYFDPPWWLATLMGLGILVIGGIAGFFAGRHPGWQNLESNSDLDEAT